METSFEQNRRILQDQREFRKHLKGYELFDKMVNINSSFIILILPNKLQGK